MLSTCPERKISRDIPASGQLCKRRHSEADSSFFKKEYGLATGKHGMGEPFCCESSGLDTTDISCIACQLHKKKYLPVRKLLPCHTQVLRTRQDRMRAVKYILGRKDVCDPEEEDECVCRHEDITIDEDRVAKKKLCSCFMTDFTDAEFPVDYVPALPKKLKAKLPPRKVCLYPEVDPCADPNIIYEPPRLPKHFVRRMPSKKVCVPGRDPRRSQYDFYFRPPPCTTCRKPTHDDCADYEDICSTPHKVYIDPPRIIKRLTSQPVPRNVLDKEGRIVGECEHIPAFEEEEEEGVPAVAKPEPDVCDCQPPAKPKIKRYRKICGFFYARCAPPKEPEVHSCDEPDCEICNPPPKEEVLPPKKIKRPKHCLCVDDRKKPVCTFCDEEKPPEKPVKKPGKKPVGDTRVREKPIGDTRMREKPVKKPTCNLCEGEIPVKKPVCSACEREKSGANYDPYDAELDPTCDVCHKTKPEPDPQPDLVPDLKHICSQKTSKNVAGFPKRCKEPKPCKCPLPCSCPAPCKCRKRKKCPKRPRPDVPCQITCPGCKTIRKPICDKEEEICAFTYKPKRGYCPNLGPKPCSVPCPAPCKAPWCCRAKKTTKKPCRDEDILLDEDECKPGEIICPPLMKWKCEQVCKPTSRKECTCGASGKRVSSGAEKRRKVDKKHRGPCCIHPKGRRKFCCARSVGVDDCDMSRYGPEGLCYQPGCQTAPDKCGRHKMKPLLCKYPKCPKKPCIEDPYSNQPLPQRHVGYPHDRPKTRKNKFEVECCMDPEFNPKTYLGKSWRARICRVAKPDATPPCRQYAGGRQERGRQERGRQERCIHERGRQVRGRQVRGRHERCRHERGRLERKSVSTVSGYVSDRTRGSSLSRQSSANVVYKYGRRCVNAFKKMVMPKKGRSSSVY